MVIETVLMSDWLSENSIRKGSVGGSSEIRSESKKEAFMEKLL